VTKNDTTIATLATTIMPMPEQQQQCHRDNKNNNAATTMSMLWQAK